MEEPASHLQLPACAMGLSSSTSEQSYYGKCTFPRGPAALALASSPDVAADGVVGQA